MISNASCTPFKKYSQFEINQHKLLSNGLARWNPLVVCIRIFVAHRQTCAAFLCFSASPRLHSLCVIWFPELLACPVSPSNIKPAILPAAGQKFPMSVATNSAKKPSQIRFKRPAQMSLFAKIYSYPPLGEVTLVSADHGEVRSPLKSARSVAQ